MYYTWLDIEWKIKSERKNWPSNWKIIDVYPDELVIYFQKSNNEELINAQSQAFNFLNKILGDSFNYANKNINLQITNKNMDIVFEYPSDDLKNDKVPLPLFKNSFYQESTNFQYSLNKFTVPVVAFHSYKGGVGRTLSLIALLRELSRNKNFKALIVDADIEAPGLTLMSEDYGFPSENRISYADILSIIHDSATNSLFGEILHNISKSMINSTITVPGIDVNVEHFFLPAYRFMYQMLDNFVHPENIVSMPERTYIIQDFLSKIGEALKVNAVLIDLRAGFSELSAPFLFDPRIKKIFVTTTSKQSIDGTKKILNEVINSTFSQGYVNNDESTNITVLLTMIPRNFNEDRISKITVDLLGPIANNQSSDKRDSDDDTILSDIVIQSRFSDNLIHTEDIDSINESLKGTPVLQSAEVLAKRLALFNRDDNKKIARINELSRELIFNAIHEIAETEITAEGRSNVNIMATAALEKLCRINQDVVPKLVILGAKGSGKTYLYKQLLDNIYWEAFCEKVLLIGRNDKRTLIVPALATKNRKAMKSLLEKCFSKIQQEINTDSNIGVLNRNEQILQKANEDPNIKATEWLNIWNNMLLESIGRDKCTTLAEFDNKLTSIEKKIVFVFDGLEDIFNETIKSKNSQAAIKYLCQDIVNQFTEYKNIGIVIFIRNDITRNSILTNYEQFEKQYADYSLKWSQDEALRLVIWILAQADFFKNNRIIMKDEKDIPKLSRSSLDECLIPFWGLKLGRNESNEAFSTRWIITALSDLKLQIQARDIIRFLSFATLNYTSDLYYHDRIILPSDIKKAIPLCSEKKLEEVYKEMVNLEFILKKLENPGKGIEKNLPLRSEDMNEILNSEDRSQLEAQGYLILDNNSYYIPEIIRHALGYEYTHGARPRVLSLLQKTKSV